MQRDFILLGNLFRKSGRGLHFRRGKQFNHMSVRISEKDLPRSVGPLLSRTKLRAGFSEMQLPRVQFVHPQREMISPIAGCHGFGTIADEMQFLIRSQPKPCARKRERRTRNLLKLQNAVIKLTAPCHIGNVERDVIQFLDFHPGDDAITC